MASEITPWIPLESPPGISSKILLAIPSEIPPGNFENKKPGMPLETTRRIPLKIQGFLRKFTISLRISSKAF